MTSATASTIYPLANPKGVAFLCELCSMPATVVCTKCRVTYYCNEVHQKADWIGVHERICQLLIPLRSKNLPPAPFMSLVETLQYRNDMKERQQQELLTITSNIARRLMFEGRYEDAMPAALQALHLTIDLFGVTSIQLVAPNLILAEVCIGLENPDKAEEFLSRAEWTVLNTPDCPLAMHHRMCRIFGILFITKGNYAKARRYLAEDIYYASKAFGTNSIQTSGGYFHLAKCFQMESKMEVADAVFNKVIDLWCEYLTTLTRDKMYGLPAPQSVSYLETSTVEEVKRLCMNEAEIAEALLVLNTIYQLRLKLQQMFALPKNAHCLAMLHYITGDNSMAIEYGRVALIGSPSDCSEQCLKDAHEFMKEYVHIRRQRQSKFLEDDISKELTTK